MRVSLAQSLRDIGSFLLVQSRKLSRYVSCALFYRTENSNFNGTTYGAEDMMLAYAL